MKQTRRMPFDLEKAKRGAKIVTRNGLNVTIRAYLDEESYRYPIEAIIKDPTGKITSKDTLYYSKEGRLLSSGGECDLDLLIEEEEETDNYNPYKEVVKSISDMVERYTELQSLEDLKDFYDNVKVKCREAVEYDKKWCKKQDEKPADNKPKFQKGDWVTDIDKPGVVHQITDVIKNVTNHTYGYNAVSFTYGVFGYSYFSEKVKSMRLWDIKDAKSGDILASKDAVFIFKHIDKTIPSLCRSYCEVIMDSRLGLGFDFPTNNVYPATKEQRDLLFQKMKEAGYEWDSDKKEIHKIEKFKTRRMTNQELSWWIRSCPEEHREYCHKGGNSAHFNYYYSFEDANKPIDDNLLIRKNGGEWQEPLVEI